MVEVLVDLAEAVLILVDLVEETLVGVVQVAIFKLSVSLLKINIL
jgi:hypothetical protein